MNSEYTGSFSVILFLSIPILRDSVATGLIDILPVTGLLLIISARLGITGSAGYRGALSGFGLAAALWTHSQAILFLPLFGVLIAIDNRFNPKATFIESSIGYGFAISIAAFPYLRNTILFGSPVSDTPAVFAIPYMYWSEYFMQTRGLPTLSSQIQYGLLKGWFSIGSFGLFFWFLIPGVIAAIVLGVRKPHSTETCRIARILLAVFVTYYSGVIASLSLGIDLMIRNDRYILAWIGPFTILAGLGLSSLTRIGIHAWHTHPKSRAKREIVAASLAIALFMTLVAPTTTSVTIDFLQAALPFRKSHEISGRLDQLANIRLAKGINTSTQPSAVILAMRPSDMYYQNRRMISYLDPRLIPSYSSDSVEETVRRLREVGITHIQQPSYFMPPTYRTLLGRVIADPHHTRLVLDDDLYQLYELIRSGKTINTSVDLSGPDTHWERAYSIPLLQRSQLRIEARPHPHAVGTPSVTSLPLGIFQRDFSTVLKSTHRVHLNKSGEYRFDFDISGAGYVKVSVRFCSSELQLGELVLERPNTRTKFQRRFISPIDADGFELRIEHLGTSHLVVHNVSLDSLESSAN